MDLDPPPGEMYAGTVPLTGTLTARAPGSPASARDADRAVAVLYAAHYRPLVRLAALLAGDVAAAEQVVQESFVAMHGGWRLAEGRRPGAARTCGSCGEPVPGAAGARCGGRRAACAFAAGARGTRARALRGPVRGTDRRGDGDEPGAVRCHTARARLALHAVLESGHGSRVTAAHPPGSEHQRDSDVAAEQAEADPRRQR